MNYFEGRMHAREKLAEEKIMLPLEVLVVSYWARKGQKKALKSYGLFCLQHFFGNFRKTDLVCQSNTGTLALFFQVICVFWRNAYVRLLYNRFLKRSCVALTALPLYCPALPPACLPVVRQCPPLTTVSAYPVITAAGL